MLPRPRSAPALLAGTLLLAGCAGAALRDESPAFFAAYDDGCLTGYSMLMPGYDPLAYRDAARYAADADYRRGFDFGYEECYFHAETASSPGGG